MSVAFVNIDWQGRTVRIEHQWLNAHLHDAPLMVFLHEGLGSLAMWRDTPQQLCNALGVRGLVYSRPGYGQSTPRAAEEHWAPNFMHRQAHEVLPALLHALHVQEAPWLFGHSDGGTIALLFASRHATAGVMVLAPHIMVEDVSVNSIAAAKEAYETTELRQRLARYHSDVDSAFWGWNRIWLAPEFRSWSIAQEITTITCPVLAVQGLNDAYGTLAQIRQIQHHVPHTELLEIEHCGHSPHRDQAQVLTRACVNFFHAQSKAQSFSTRNSQYN